MLVAISSVVTWVLESLPACRHIIEGKEIYINNATTQKVNTYLRYTLPIPILWFMDIVFAIILTMDYILRFIVSPVKWRFMIQPLNVADILGLVPMIIVVCMDIYQQSYEVSENFHDAMYVLNILRVLRVLRMFRMMKHYKPFKIVFWAWQASYKELILLVIIILVSSCVFGSIIYFIELHEDNFITIPHGMWWAIVTMTTVGYGDIVPVTPIGSILGCVCAITGLLVIAMPIPVIVQNFSRYHDAVRTTDRLLKHDGKDTHAFITAACLQQEKSVTSKCHHNKIAPQRKTNSWM